MIRDLKVAENKLKDEQKVLTIIHLLPNSDWSQMKLLMTYGENIKTFSDISRYLELVAECMEASSLVALVARSHKHCRFKPKREKCGDNVEQKNKNQTPQDEYGNVLKTNASVVEMYQSSSAITTKIRVISLRIVQSRDRQPFHSVQSILFPHML